MLVNVEKYMYASPFKLKERVRHHSWEKETVKFALRNQSKILSIIRTRLKSLNLLNKIDHYEVYQEYLIYLMRAEDYDAEKSKGMLGDYAVSCLKSVIKRIVSEYHKRSKVIVDNVIYDDGEEVSLFDFIPGDSSMPELLDANEVLRSAEHLRYKYGVDILLIVYLRLLCDDDSLYRQCVDITLGIKDLKSLEIKLRNDEEFLNLIKILSEMDKEKAVHTLGRIVYGADYIRETIEKEIIRG